MSQRWPASATASEFCRRSGDYLAEIYREPLVIVSRGGTRRAVVISPEFYDRAVEALEDQVDIRAADTARRDTERISHKGLVTELGLDEELA